VKVLAFNLDLESLDLVDWDDKLTE